MLAEVRLIIASREARLVCKRSETEVEDEVWTFDAAISRSEARVLSEAVFHDAFDLLQNAVYGNGDS